MAKKAKAVRVFCWALFDKPRRFAVDADGRFDVYRTKRSALDCLNFCHGDYAERAEIRSAPLRKHRRRKP